MSMRRHAPAGNTRTEISVKLVYRPALRHFAVNASVNSGAVGAPEFTAANREFWLRGILLLLRRHNSCMVQKTGEPLNGSPVFGHIDGLHY